MRHALLAVLASVSALEAADPVRLAVAGRSTHLLPQAVEQFERRHGAGLLEVRIAGDGATPELLAGADAVFVYYLPAETFERLRGAAKGVRQVLASPKANAERHWNVRIDGPVNEQAERYWEYGGVENLTGFLELVYTRAGGARKIAVTPPAPQMAAGLYHPRSDRAFTNMGECLAWYRARKFVPDGAPLVGVLMYQQAHKFRDLAHIDALIAGLERRGIGAVPVFGWPVASLDAMLTVEGKTPLRLLMALNLGFSKDEDARALERWGLHVMNLLVSTDSYEQWRGDPRGVAPHRLPALLNAPERVGATEPLLVATTEKAASGATYTSPVPERLAMAVSRAARWLALQDKPNPEKRAAIIYYNNPPGKGNLGASYLSIMPSIVTILERLEAEGYRTGSRLPDERELIDLLHRSGRNIELWAPGELEELVEQGRVALVSMARYKQWFGALPREFREFVLKVWGPPESSRLMTVAARDGRKYFVVPGVRFGNIFLGPQPLRSTFERATAVQHDTLTPPPHSYIAAYLWYRHEYRADAIVHLGRHGTLEWLPGKAVGQAGWDSSEVLLGDLPAAYYFIIDGGGEAIQARRRAASVMIGHLTPMITGGGRQEEFAKLMQALESYESARETSPALAAEYLEEAKQEIARLKLDRQLGLKLDALSWKEVHERVEDLLDAAENGPTPLGMPSVGKLPRDEILRAGLAGFIRFHFSKEEARGLARRIDEWAAAVADGRPPANVPEKARAVIEDARLWWRNLHASAPAELDSLIAVLGGRYLASGLLGDPLRVPQSLPSGRNLHDFDTSLIPTKAAWELGRKMAEDTLARYRKEHGAYPEKVSMVLWYGETGRHHGAMECQALWLMGVEPEWNARGVVDKLRLVPEEKLGRPRVDVVFNISGVYRDGFADKVLLLDRAARMAASAGENAISRHDRAVRAALERAGVAPEAAEKAAKARVFGAESGAYGTGIVPIVEQSEDEGKGGRIAEMYLHHMNYAYSGEVWGKAVPRALERHLEGNQAVIHSRTTNVYGVLDNDDFYQFAGGLNTASKVVNGGAVPSFYINNLRARGRENVDDFRAFLVKELNTRNWNPKWIREMQNAGYAGAREFAKEIEHLYGWQATSAEHVDGELWQRTFEVYVADKHGLDMDRFFEKNNPHIRQFILSRLLEVDRQGSYKFSATNRARIAAEYVRSVARHGVACSANTCGNLRVNQYAASEAALVSGLGNLDLRAFGKQLARATHWSGAQFAGAPAAVRAGLREAAAGRVSRVARSVPRMARPAAAAMTQAPRVSGFVMREKVWNVGGPARGTAPDVAAAVLAALAALLAAGALREALRAA